MPKVKVDCQSKLSAEDTYKRVRTLLDSDRDLRKLDSSYKCEFNDSSMSGTAKGSKFEASMKISAQGTGSRVEVEVSLPMLLTPVKGVVQSTLQKKLEAALA